MNLNEARAANQQARQLVVSRAQKLTQKIYSTTVTPSAQSVINVQPRNVGLILGFYVVVTGNMASAAGVANLTNLGISNVLSQVTFTDLQNYTRIQTTGWHLMLVAAAKNRQPFGSCMTLTSYPMDFDNNFNVITGTATQNNVAASKRCVYWIPLAYSDYDLRGAIYAAVVNATMNLQLTISLATFVAAGDAVLAVYSGQAGATSATNGWSSTVTIDVYQVYYDQLPKTPEGLPILPQLDLSTVYELKNTAMTGMSANQDFQIPYSNFRDYLSTVLIYDNNGTLNVGSDINYLALQAANFVNLFNVEPHIAALWGRNVIGTDFPNGTYYFDTRNKPISTVQYGNMNLVINASVVASCTAFIGWEDFGQQNQLLGAGGLATG